MRKREVITGLTFVMVTLVAGSCVSSGRGGGANVFKNPGTYVGEAQGMFGSPVQVSVTVDAKMILSIETTHSETNGIGDRAIDKMTGDVLGDQTLNVDSVSAATMSSAAFRTAVTDALLNPAKAGGNESLLNTRPAHFVYRNTTANVVVVGAGGTGFSAAIRLKTERPDMEYNSP